jgi:hypothetical protein
LSQQVIKQGKFYNNNDYVHNVITSNSLYFIETQASPYDNEQNCEWVPSDNDSDSDEDILDQEDEHEMEVETEEIPEDNDQQYMDHGDDDETRAQKVTCNTRYVINI